MSGLSVLFHRDSRPICEHAIWSMLKAAPYRGPDGMAVEIIDTVGLGHAKMAVTLEDEHDIQPLISPRTGCALIADVRLDNRDELLALLPSRPTGTICDSELILRSYETWGAEAVERLLGDFAFVIWDPRSHCIVAARDASGQRALFYRVDNHTFAAASEIQQLFQDSTIPMVPNEERIKEFLVPLNLQRVEKDSPSTFYKGIFAVPAGHTLIVSRETMSVRPYWQLAPVTEIRYRRDEEYSDHFWAVFSQAVNVRLRTTGRIGALLSGGLDSSAVVCTALQLFQTSGRATSDFTSISSVFAGLECDEQIYIQDIQTKYGIDARYISPGEISGRLQIEPVGFMESPNMGVGEVRHAMLGAAHSSGVRVLLTGEVADACVGGTRYVFDSLLRQGRLRDLFRHFQAFRDVSQDSFQKIALLYCLAPLLPLKFQRQINLWHMRRQVPWLKPRLLPYWMPEALRTDLAERHVRTWLETEMNRRFSNPTLETEFRLLHPPEVARHPVPWPIEYWRPFADRRLHQFLLAIPPEQKFEPHPETVEFYAGSKRLVRRALRGVLPETIRTRTTKTVFNSAARAEIVRNWPVYEMAFGSSSRSELAERGYVDQAKFWSRLQQIQTHGEGPDAFFISMVVGLESWLRTFRLPRALAGTVALGSPTRKLSVP